MPLLRYAEVQVDSYAATFYDGKLRVKLTYFLEKHNRASENGSDLEVVVQEEHNDEPLPKSFKPINAKQLKFSKNSVAAGGGETDGVFFNALPSTGYKILLQPRGIPFRENAGQDMVKDLPNDSDHTTGHSSQPMVLYFR